MKFVLAAIIILLSTSAPAQDLLPTKDGRVYYEIIDSSVSGNADQLYNKAKLWFVDAFKDAKEVIQLDDKENKTIVGKGLFRYNQGVAPYACKFTVKVMTKDNKYRAQIYDFTIEAGTERIPSTGEYYNDNSSYKKFKEKSRVKINEGVSSLLDGLKSWMNKKTDDSF